jgi:hypothetical protein
LEEGLLLATVLLLLLLLKLERCGHSCLVESLLLEHLYRQDLLRS